MFVKWNCGCVGLHPKLSEPVSGQPIIVELCDRDGGDDDSEPVWAARDMTDKSFTPLSMEEDSAVVLKIREVFSDAYKFRAIKRIMRL